MTRSTPVPLPTRRPLRTPDRRPATVRAGVRYCDTATRGSVASAGRRLGAGAASTQRQPARVPARRPAGSVRTASMRLTRRGRVLLTTLAVLVFVVVFSLGRATSNAATSGAPRSRPTVVVAPGETLWQLAQRVAPAADPRVTVERILVLNDLTRADQVRPGQQIVLPR